MQNGALRSAADHGRYQLALDVVSRYLPGRYSLNAQLINCLTSKLPQPHDWDSVNHLHGKGPQTVTIKSNPTDAVARWRAGVGAAGQRYTSGVQNSTDWAAAATSPAAVNARNTGLQRAIANGTIDQGIQKIGTAGWRNATVAKAANWQNGVNSQVAQANATQGFQRLFQYLQTAENAISSLPRGGFAENMQRSQAYLTSVHDQAQAAKGY